MSETRGLVKCVLGFLLSVLVIFGGVYGFNVEVEVTDTETQIPAETESVTLETELETVETEAEEDVTPPVEETETIADEVVETESSPAESTQFVGGGLLANYANLIVRKYKDADASAFAKAFINAMNESNFDITEDDLPTLTEQIKDIVKVYADNNANSRKNKIRGVASGITGSVEITDDEQKELERAINKLKSSGIDTTTIDKAYEQAKSDGKITVSEKANLEAVIRAIHNVTNI